MLVKGFVNMQSLVSNVEGETAQFGELSPFGMTFSREVGQYQSDIYTDYTLLTFTCVDNNNSHITLSQVQVNQILAVVNSVQQYLHTHLPPYSIELIRAHVYDQLASTVSNLNIGQIDDDLPHWISWEHPVTHDSFRIWLHNLAFINQYDDYNIVVVPPIPNLDDFFLATNIVANKIETNPIETIAARAHIAKDGDPESYYLVHRYDFIDPLNRTIKINTNWIIMVYGEAGNNIDSIKDAIIDYILTHSTHTRTEWEVIFPDIFKRTEFVMIPRWDKYSIPNMLTQTGLHSQVLDPLELVSQAKNYIGFYTQAHIQNNCYTLPHPYKCIMMTLVNGQHNIDGKKDFKVLYRDYLPINTASLDFNRMSLETQEIIIGITEMLIEAETMTEYSFMPTGLKRVKREGKLYLTKLMQNINFVMVPKVMMS